VSAAETVGVNWKENFFHFEEIPLTVWVAKTCPLVEDTRLVVISPEKVLDFT